MVKPTTHQPKAPKAKPSQDQVARKAFAVYQQEGRSPGHAEQNWLDHHQVRLVWMTGLTMSNRLNEG